MKIHVSPTVHALDVLVCRVLYGRPQDIVLIEILKVWPPFTSWNSDQARQLLSQSSTTEVGMVISCQESSAAPHLKLVIR